MTFFVILGSVALIVVFWFKRKRRIQLPLPPGPPGDPILGHFRLIPQEHQELQFYEWGKIYGEVIHLNLFGRSFVVLNGVQAAIDLLDKRSANYSDRPRFIVLELLGFMGYTISLMPYGKRFQRHRRMMHEHLMADRSERYSPIQLRETRVLLKNLLSKEAEHEKLILRFSTAIIMQVAFGHQVMSDDDVYVKIAQESGNIVANAGPPGGTPIDFFPFLQYLPSWFPGAYYAGYARERRDGITRMFDYPFEQMQTAMASGTANPCFLSHHLEGLNRDGGSYPNTAADIKGAAAQLYFAAMDTTASSLSTFFLAMTLYPECQLKAQKEIDAVVGAGRLPDFSDIGSLPYVECIVQETLRWLNAVPMGIPHRSMEDDIYNGMFIPKGSIIIANTRAMTLDERIYADPHTFNPSRYLPKPEGNAEPNPIGPFGFGRRICPGRQLAHGSIWIAVASVLATMSISKAVGEDGKEIIPKVDYSSGITSHPQPYQCLIQPRNEAARDLISRAIILDSY
ncbi:hypothetical protein Hypma_001256 [Hypsizygus marmoreus]|uniref:O-methylsterigmatocystin oxidoreductase n=1 Tax=Hypsizygus marmoreus TaxID=39966 RepID=A0A369J8L2_HYPMA|nr:hypothetical protein Hypma_001256 [Hypsizygus marmoreus]